jgi:hypothetical protein
MLSNIDQLKKALDNVNEEKALKNVESGKILVKTKSFDDVAQLKVLFIHIYILKILTFLYQIIRRYQILTSSNAGHLVLVMSMMFHQFVALI